MTLPVPITEPDPEYADRMHTAAALAIEVGAGVGLWVVLDTIRTDGFPALADAITRDMVNRLVARAATDPVLFARLLHLLLETP